VSRVEDGGLNITKSGGYKQNSVPSFSLIFELSSLERTFNIGHVRLTEGLGEY